MTFTWPVGIGHAAWVDVDSSGCVIRWPSEQPEGLPGKPHGPAVWALLRHVLITWGDVGSLSIEWWPRWSRMAPQPGVIECSQTITAGIAQLRQAVEGVN